ncbi:hypothetical protein BP00DRAFT_474221 [Aspergillus indologenus CBS 114.80]|uniref:Fe2OG dioxygenase domain-containing protein n=1 Tax=Aspergillus indologenus CBS 114.80 TaxID=1450541 RepID=A0A2V5JA52_9EURO|nr:hypothetical protein BP00DRAFT_474221 [Aspergillus indologenus CBS 114.80]
MVSKNCSFCFLWQDRLRQSRSVCPRCRPDLPLEESQARRIIKKAHQAPYREGSETIVDIPVRNRWELNPDQFKLRNSNWNTFLKSVIAGVSQELGLDLTVHAELYKMLIDEEGAILKAHAHTENAPDVVATLVIGLPSSYEGGAVTERHRGFTRSVKLSSRECSYGCWYAGLVHEVLPVTSGYRWVLTYNLTIDASETRLPRALRQPDTLPLYSAIARWLKQVSDNSLQGHFWYQLDHRYTDASISLKALEFRDLACVQALCEISTRLPVDIFLGVLQREEWGNCEFLGPGSLTSRNRLLCKHNANYHPLRDVLSRTHAVKSLVDLNGDWVFQEMQLDAKSILQKDRFGDIPAYEDYRGYPGNCVR